MNRKFEIAGFIVVWLSVIVQFILIIQNRGADLAETFIRFFSFFTILTNTLIAIYFTVKVFNIQRKPLRFLLKNSAITASTVFILIVGIVYQIALRAVWEPTGIQKIVDEFLHTIIPLYFFIYWTIDHKGVNLRIRSILKCYLRARQSACTHTSQRLTDPIP